MHDYINFAADFAEKHGRMPEIDEDLVYVQSLDCSKIVRHIDSEDYHGYFVNNLRCEDLNKKPIYFEISYYIYFHEGTKILKEVERKVRLRKGDSRCSFRFIDFASKKSFSIKKDERVGCGQDKLIRLGQ